MGLAALQKLEEQIRQEEQSQSEASNFLEGSLNCKSVGRRVSTAASAGKTGTKKAERQVSAGKRRAQRNCDWQPCKSWRSRSDRRRSNLRVKPPTFVRRRSIARA